MVGCAGIASHGGEPDPDAFWWVEIAPVVRELAAAIPDAQRAAYVMEHLGMTEAELHAAITQQ